MQIRKVAQVDLPPGLRVLLRRRAEFGGGTVTISIDGNMSVLAAITRRLPPVFLAPNSQAANRYKQPASVPPKIYFGMGGTAPVVVHAPAVEVPPPTLLRHCRRIRQTPVPLGHSRREFAHMTL